MKREVLAYVPDPRNTLIVYGPRRVTRSLLGEERAGLYTDKIFAYHEIEGAPESSTPSTGWDRFKRWLAKAG